MRQRLSGTEHVYLSNVIFLYQSYSYLPDESTEAFSTEILMVSTPDNTKYPVFRILFSKMFIAHNLTKRVPKFPTLL